MKGDLEETLDLPLDHFQAAAGLPTGSPMQSSRLRKSVNWARPLATSILKQAVKRSSSRLSGKELASITPSSGAIEPEKNVKEIIESSEEQRPIRFVTPGTKRRGRKPEPAVAGPQEPPQESRRLLLELQQESRHCSKEESDSKTQKKARIVLSGEDQLDANVGIEPEKEWVSVPLNTMEARMEGEEDTGRNQECMNPEADASSLRPSDNEATKTAEARRNVPFCSFNKEWQEKIPEISKRKADVDTYATVNKELCEYLSQFLAGAKTVVHDVEHVIHDLRESQLNSLREENKRILEMAAVEQEKLRSKISELSQKNSRILEEKLAIERERDYRESLRLETEKKHGETAEALRKDLGKEQEKNSCQICFNSPRDAIVLPCMHFLYCSDCLGEHQRRQKGCPTCRTKINGVLRCNLRCTS